MQPQRGMKLDLRKGESMKLVRFKSGERVAIGVVCPGDEKLIDLALAGGDTGGTRFPSSMTQFLSKGEAGIADAQSVVASVGETGAVSLDAIELLSPLGDPGKIICVGQNYRDHCAEQNQPIPESAIIFSKYQTALNDPGGAISLPKVTQKADYEAEFAFVIGKKGKDIPESEAMEYVAGYMCANDISARDIQFADKQWVRGKTPDGFFPTGPYLVTKDEIEDPHNLNISLKLNGTVMQNSNTSNLIFNVPFLIAYLSQTMTLLPGDIVTTGTPGGVGVFRDPPIFLKSGDQMEVTIQGLGTLKNSVA